MSPEEQAAIEQMLGQWSIGFGVKAIVFGILVLIMVRQRAKSHFGIALNVHYATITIQAIIMFVTYRQYHEAAKDGTGFLSFDKRMRLYEVGNWSIWAVILSAITLIVLYFVSGTPDGSARSE